MTESTARAALFERQSATSPIYVWEVAQKPVCVRIPFPVIDRLEHEAVESFRSLSSRGSEIGGVLYGSVLPGQPLSVSIEDYELIECDYSRGPLYRLGDADMSRFDRAILQHGASGPLAVVGLFRSHTRKGLALDTDDLSFFDSRFREPHHIALLIRPFATKASSGGIFIREGGTVNGEASYLEFPFRSSLLTPGKPPAEAIEPPPAPTGLGGALPAPTVPRTTARGQIVPIASRRESSPVSAPEPVTPVSAAPPVAEPVKPAEVSAAPAAAPPKVIDPPKPVAKVEEKPAPPKVEERTIKPKVEEKAAAPKVEERAIKPKVEEKAAAPKVEERAIKPKVEERAAAPKVEERAIKPKVEDKAASTKVEEKTTKAKPEEKAATAKASSTYSFTASPAVETQTQPEGSGSGKMLWIGLGGLVSIIVLVVLFVYPALLRHKPASIQPLQDTSQLSLRVERTSGEILLTWNRDSDAIRNATHAVLSIADGSQHENVEMDLPQLRNGSISYSPASGDVIFKMEVTGKGNVKTASESVRALQTKPNPTAGPEQPPQAAQTPGKSTPGVKPPDATSSNPNAATGNSASTAPEQQAPAQEEAPAKTAQPLRPFQAPSLSQRLHPVGSSDLPDAPSLGRTDTSSPAVSGLNFNSVSAPIAPKPAGAAPATPAQTPSVDKKPATGGQIQSAVLIKRKEPEYPKLARENGAKGTVELIATIGTDGKVKKVQIVRGPAMLQKAASDAVLQWLYKPTMLNGVAVEAQTQVLVNFMGADR